MSNLKVVRTRLNLTQEKVAAIIGTSKAMVSHYEAGRPEIPPAAARKLIVAASKMGHIVSFNEIYDVQSEPVQQAAAA